MNDVFISYSRRDKVFTQKLFEALKAANRDTWADWEDIPASSDWDAEIKQGIQETNSVLFVLSPEWIKSKECRKEMVHAVAMGKRLFPILYLPVEPKDVPPELAKINWVYMRDTDDFDKAFQTLCSAMDTDLEWIKTHTRIQVRALEWEKKNRSASFALRGEDLTEGEKFIAGAANKTPVPTALQSEYILASRKDATKRQRQTLAGVTVALVVSIALAVVAAFQWRAALKQATISRSQVLAVNSQLNPDKKSLNLLFGIESFNLVKNYSYPDRILAEQALRDSLGNISGIPLSGHEGHIYRIAFSPDGRWLATGGDDKTVRLWDMKKPAKVPIVVEGNEGIIWSLAFSPDDRWLATGTCEKKASDGFNCSQGVVRIWSLDNLDKDPVVLEGYKGQVYSLAFSPDSQWLASGSKDKTAHLWKVGSSSTKYTILNRHQGSITGLAFSPDGQWLATGSDDATACLWNVNTPPAKCILLEGNKSSITSLAFSPDGQWLATADYGATLVWKVDGHSKASTLEGHTAQITSLAFSPDSQWLATGSEDKTARLWKVNDPDGYNIVLDVDNGPITAVAFSPDGQWLATGSCEVKSSDNSVCTPGIIRLWNTQRWISQDTSAEPLILQGHEGYISVLTFSPDGQWLASGGYDSTARLWNLKNLFTQPIVLMDHPDPVLNAVLILAFSPDNQWLVSSSRDATLHRWNVMNPEVQPNVFEGDEDTITALAFSPDGQWLATGNCGKKSNDVLACAQGIVRLRDVNNLADKPIVLGGYKDKPGALTISPDGQWLATTDCKEKLSDDSICNQNVLRIRNLKNSATALLALDDGSEGMIRSLAFSPDSQWLATWGQDKTIRLWNIRGLSNTPKTLNGYGDTVLALAFSPDGQWLATGNCGKMSSDGFFCIQGVIRLWNMKKLTDEPRALHGHGGLIYSLAFSPDSRWLASGSYDKTARLWNMENLSSDPIVFHGHKDRVYSVAFSPNGQWLATGGEDDTIRLWSLNYGYLLERACQVVGRNFTREEWAQYGFIKPYRKTCEQWPLESEATPTPTAIP